MVKQALSTHLCQYYEEKDPTSEKLTQLLEMANMANSQSLREESPDQPASTPSGPKRRSRHFRLTLGLSVAFSVILAFFLLLPTANVTQGVSKEILLNHNKGLALDFLTEDYADLRKRMPKLDFSLVNSKEMMAQNFKMIGGRYCSIQGEIAAQIRLKDDAGQVFTLYQTVLTDDLLKLNVGEQEQEGLKLKLWREAGLLFALVGPID